jgi:hypothetical protein
MTFTDSDLIIGILDVIGKGLNFIGDFIGTTEGMVVALVLVGNAIVNIIGARSKEYNLQKKQYELQKLMAKEEAEKLRAEAKEDFKRNPKRFLSKKQGKKFDKEFGEKTQEVTAAEEQLNADTEAVLAQEKIVADAKKLWDEEAAALKAAQEAYDNELKMANAEAQHQTAVANIEAEAELEKQKINEIAEAKELAEQGIKTEVDKEKIEKVEEKKDEASQKALEKELTAQEKLEKAKNKAEAAEKKYNDEKRKQEELTKKQINSQKVLTKAQSDQNEVLNRYFEGTKENLAINQAMAESQEHLNVVSSTFQIIMTGISVVTGIVNGVKAVGTLISTIYTAATAAEGTAEKTAARAKLQATAAQWGLNGAMYACPIVWIIALIVAAIAVVALLVVGIIALAKAFKANNDESAKAAKSIKDLNAQIYEFDQKANKLKSSISVFEDLDDKVLKTKEDMEAMNAEMDKIAESMSDEEINEKEKKRTDKENMVASLTGGMSEKDYYDSLTTDKAKREFAEKLAKGYDDLADNKRREQISTLAGISVTNQKALLENDMAVADAVYAINNNSLYDTIDALETKIGLDEEERKSLETLTQSVLENMDA